MGSTAHLFAVAFAGVGWAVREQGWRAAWGEIALILLAGMLPIAWLLVRNGPRDADGEFNRPEAAAVWGMSLAQGLKTGAFWAFALATSAYGLAVSRVGLFNEAILLELGFDRKTYHTTLVVTALVALLSQLASGWIGGKWPLRRLAGIAMGLYAVSLFWPPYVTTLPQLWGNAALLGAAGGIMTVVFFAVWPEYFGRAHLGRIQGAAQLLTVVSSAVGPLLFAQCATRTGSYAPVFQTLAPVVMVLARGHLVCASAPVRTAAGTFARRRRTLTGAGRPPSLLACGLGLSGTVCPIVTVGEARRGVRRTGFPLLKKSPVRVEVSQVTAQRQQEGRIPGPAAGLIHETSPFVHHRTGKIPRETSRRLVGRGVVCRVDRSTGQRPDSV